MNSFTTKTSPMLLPQFDSHQLRSPGCAFCSTQRFYGGKKKPETQQNFKTKLCFGTAAFDTWCSNEAVWGCLRQR